MGFSLGGNKSNSKANMSQEVWGPQGAALENLYGYGNQMFQNNPYANLGMGYMNQAMPYMQGAANSGASGSQYMLGGGAYGDTSGLRNNLYQSLMDSAQNPSQVGKMYEDIVGGPGNTYIDPMVSSMKEGMLQNLASMQSGTGLDAAAMGQSGSNRHAMQNAMQAAQVNRDMAAMENSMRGNAYDTDLNWKMNIAQQADLGRGAAQDRMMSALSGSDANRQYGLGYQPVMQNLGMGMMAPWMQAQNQYFAPLQMMASAYGPPTVLSSGTQKGKSGGFGFGF